MNTLSLRAWIEGHPEVKLYRFFSHSMDDAIKDTSKELAEAFAQVIRGHIEDQDLDWVELSDSWLKYKEARGWSQDIFKATGALYRSIGTYVLQDSPKTITIAVGAVLPYEGGSASDEYGTNDGQKLLLYLDTLKNRHIIEPSYNEVKDMGFFDVKFSERLQYEWNRISL